MATFIGRHCGSGWREQGLAERVLDEVAKAWKRNNGGVILDDTPDKKLVDVLKQVESCMSGGRIDTGRLSRTNSGVGNAIRESRPTISSREDSQTSLGLSGLDVEDDTPANLSDDDSLLSKQDARSYLKVIDAFTQPRLTYSTTKKTLEIVTTPPSLFPPPSNRIALFRNRYNLVHQRLMRNESFQTPSFAITARGNRPLQRSASSLTVQQAYKITPIANLLGRSGTSHLLLGLLAIAPATGELALTDLTGSISLDLSSARPVPEDGAWFCAGMIVLIEGMYEEDGSNTGGGVGGMIGGHFFGSSIGGPPAERRDVTLGISGSSKDGSNSSVLSAGAGFGWTDFLGVGSERAQGKAMRRIQQKLLGSQRDDDDDDEQDQRRTKIAILGECHLDNPRKLEAIRKILTTYASDSVEDTPLSIIFMGNFISKASMAGAEAAGSIEYKEHFDALASVLSEFPSILSSTTLLFVPGDNDPWPSAFSAGAATPLPRAKVPDIFTSRIRRAVNNANVDAGKTAGTGEVIFTSNPAQISLFGPVEDIVLFRDDVTGRLRRSAITFDKPAEEEEEGESSNHAPAVTEIDMDIDIEEAESHQPEQTLPPSPSQSDLQARKLTKTLLDQSHLSPFPLSTRPLLWDYASSALQLYPLPTALVLCDPEAAPFVVRYEGCVVLNAGGVVEDVGTGGGQGVLGGGGGGRRGGEARWVEYDVRSRKGGVRGVRF